MIKEELKGLYQVEFQLLLKGGNVITLDDRSPEAQAVGIGKDGRINWVGKDAEIPLQAGGDAEILDLHGATVLPGFIDTHVHLLATGIYDLLVNCSISDDEGGAKHGRTESFYDCPGTTR